MSASLKDATRKATLTTPSDREIRIERVFDAPRDLVWQAFTDPKLVAQWWGRGNKLVVERLEVERGGHWRFVEHAPRRADEGLALYVFLIARLFADEHHPRGFRAGAEHDLRRGLVQIAAAALVRRRV